ncbi:MAG: DUF268 domain-containing protein [Cylindrospermopsis raciborskii KL1]|jgi:hypothetical protein|uniref:DUF268 domain-containing protein n=1 Tax=Cylindrospermopsis raciborskii TaxID=77022 RepID=UPI001A1B10A1|nr:DUF268 domain-containing protein [Cylindrospermopsis raciborskii]MBG0744577.1 DUF268 domain-containing protein [Cylindrospermopsis raciborskii KL1]
MLFYKLRSAYHFFTEFGVDPIKFARSITGIPWYLSQVILFFVRLHKSDIKNKSFSLSPSFNDRYGSAGKLDRHYFHQDLWAARKVYEENPICHVDVGSRIDGFIAHLLTFREVEVLDIRPMSSLTKGMRFRQLDIMKYNDVPVGICDSISCLHALEHFGLGRYGDPIDPEGYIKGLRSLTKLLQPEGKLLLSVPVGIECIKFNSHRTFSPKTILRCTESDYELISFSYIDDDKNFHENVSVQSFPPDLIYGCGMFEFRKTVKLK